MFLFYTPQIENGRCLFSPSESHHCAKVLRLGVGMPVLVTDGNGNLYRAVLDLVGDKCCSARIEVCLRNSDGKDFPRPRTHIVMAPTKNIERTEWFLEKATEVGLGRISFIRCGHSERKQVREDRIRGILLAAMKQSQQAYLPLLDPVCSLEQYLEDRPGRLWPENVREDPYPQKFIAYCGPEYPKKDILDLLKPRSGVEIMIGPEGDFSPGEVELCVKSGYVPVSLGPTRLRTETAALFAAWAPVYLERKES